MSINQNSNRNWLHDTAKRKEREREREREQIKETKEYKWLIQNQTKAGKTDLTGERSGIFLSSDSLEPSSREQHSLRSLLSGSSVLEWLAVRVDGCGISALHLGPFFFRVRNHDISFKGHVKNLGVYTDATLSWSLLTTSVIQHVWRSEEWAVSHSYTHTADDESHRSAYVFFCSRVGLLQLFAHWHQLWSDVQATKSSKPCSEDWFSREQIRAF